MSDKSLFEQLKKAKHDYDESERLREEKQAAIRAASIGWRERAAIEDARRKQELELAQRDPAYIKPGDESFRAERYVFQRVVLLAGRVA